MSGTRLATARWNFKWRRTAVWGTVVGLCLAFVAEAGRVLLGRNLHIVVPGRVYRSAQLSSTALEHLIGTYNIRTVVNLRGCSDPYPWYLEECRATHRFQVSQEDINLSAGRLPSVHEMRRLVNILDRTAYPILIHCKRGADRTGLISASVMLLQDQVGLLQARRQLGLRYGHLCLGRPGYLDTFFDLYEEWLRQQGQEHSPLAFRQWLQEGYCPGACRCDLELLDKPPTLPLGVPVALHVRVRNMSRQVWHFRAGKNAGVHAGYCLFDEAGNCMAYERAGLFDAEVLPDQSLDVTLPLPSLDKPGRYRLLVDMVDEPQGWFYQTGSEPLETELVVR